MSPGGKQGKPFSTVCPPAVGGAGTRRAQVRAHFRVAPQPREDPRAKLLKQLAAETSGDTGLKAGANARPLKRPSPLRGLRRNPRTPGNIRKLNLPMAVIGTDASCPLALR